MKKTTNFIMCLLFIGALFTQLQAQTVAYIGSSQKSDAQVISGLEALGYTVTADAALGTALTTDKATVLNTYDLVIIGRSNNSGSFAATYNPAWQTVSTPVLNCFNFGFRAARALWFETAPNATDASQYMTLDSAEHPIFTNTYGDPVNNFLTAQLGSDDSPNWHTVKTTDPGNGKVLASSAGTNGYVTIVEWAPNTQMWDGRGVHAGRRMIFPLPDPSLDALTADGLQLLTDMAEYMIKGTVTDISSPTDIQISSNDFPVNTPMNAPIGEFSATDPQDNAASYALVAGEGADDNASFLISGNALILNSNLDADGDKVIDSGDTDLTIRVQVTDATGKTLEKAIALTVTAYFDGPLDIFLDNTSILENQVEGTVVGVLSAADIDGNIKSYELVSGDGDEGNASFMIDGDTLKSDTTFNYEGQTSFSIRLTVTDSTDQALTKAFTIEINDIDESPTDILIDTYSIDENLPASTKVGIISGIDPQDDIVSFELADGDGNNHNPYFYIDGESLFTNAMFDYEFFDTLTVNIKATDSEGSASEKSIKIAVLDKVDIMVPTTNAQYRINIIGNATTDAGYADLLSQNGYDVDLVASLILTEEMVDSINETYDLIIITRNVNSGDFTSNPDIWQTVTTPVINMSAYVARSNRMKFINTTAALGTNDTAFVVEQPNHPVFAYAPMSADSTLAGITTLMCNSSAWIQGFGKLLATFPDGQVAMAEWNVGLPFYNGTGILEGRRMLFNGPNAYSFTERGDSLFLDAAEYMITGSIGAPNEVSIEVDALTENVAIGSTVGTLVALDRHGDVVSYALVDGEGADDNALFTLDGAVLKVADVINYESKSSVSIRVQVVDTEGNTFDEILAFTILDAPDAPYAINISGTIVDELVEAGILVGALSAMDDDMNAFNFEFATGTGDEDNASFVIDSIFSYSDSTSYVVDSSNLLADNTYAIDTIVIKDIPNYEGIGLYTAAILDFETKANLSVAVKVTDATDLSFTDAIAITVVDTDENPSDIDYSGYKITENNATGVVIGQLAGVDPQDDINVASFTLVAGEGDTNNDMVTIDGTDVKAAVVFDYESYVIISFRVKVSDVFGNSYEEVLYTSIMDDISDNPTKPTVTEPIGSVEETEGFQSTSIDLSKVFGDVDGDVLTYEFRTNNDTVVDLSVDAANNSLIITEKAVGTVTVILTAKDDDDNEINDMFKITIIENTSAINTLTDKNITVYPNPSQSGIFKLDLSSVNSNTVVTVTDMLGRTVLNQQLTSSTSEINLQGMASGKYIATIVSGNQVTVKKLIKE